MGNLTKIHEKNMSAALDQYISRIDGTPCMKTVIHLTRGAENHDFVSRRSKLLVFLKGNKEKKIGGRKPCFV